MVKFQSIPVVVEAEQYEPGKRIEGVIEAADLPESAKRYDGYYCTTVNGETWSFRPPAIWIKGSPQGIQPGDWIVTTQDGTKRVYSAAEFEAAFEPWPSMPLTPAPAPWWKRLLGDREVQP